ncbi:MAG: alpha/beta fold hydrolase [Gemmatimonadaceae bacterium]|nr:alpha/beta fold hydrolase [Gemmatimonadaceae bacterium]
MAPWLLAAGVGAFAGAMVRLRVSARHERTLRALRPRGPDDVVLGGASIALEGSSTSAALVLHGFGDTPQSVAPVAHALHAAGWTVRAPLLAGHGRSMRAMATHGADDWLASARHAYAALRATHAQVCVVGQSMGGALAVLLAVETPPPALVLLAPYLSMPLRIRRIARLLRIVAPVVPYWHANSPPRSIHDPAARARALAHPATSATALAELARLSATASARLPAVTAPTLVLQSREDNRIPPDAAQRAFDRLGAREKRLEWFTGRGHVLAVDVGHEEIAARVVTWVEAHAALRTVAPAPT